MSTETPQSKFFRLTAEHQELVPDHTYKAFMHRVDRTELPEEKCELLADVVGGLQAGDGVVIPLWALVAFTACGLCVIALLGGALVALHVLGQGVAFGLLFVALNKVVR